jgi:hypothetical protein
MPFVADVENSTETSSSDKYYAFKLLAKGELDNAINYAAQDTSINGYILRLAAVSDGAPKSMIRKALALSKNSSINSSTLIPAIALASRNNLPLQDFKEAMISNFGEYADSVYKFIGLAKQGQFAEADNLMKFGMAEVKGKMSLLGVLLVGKRAPEKWKLYANKLLYMNEKPYLSMAMKPAL